MIPAATSNPASIMKTIGRTLGLVMAIPALIGYATASVLLGKERAFTLASERLAVRGGQLGIYIRQAFYRHTTAGIGLDVCFGFMSVFSKPAVRIGQRVYIGRFCSIGWADIHDDVMLADGVQVLSGRHQHGSSTQRNILLRDNAQKYQKISIGRGAWIGAGAVVMADVAEGAVVAAGAVVVKPVPAYTRVAGMPAKPIEAHDAQTDRRPALAA